MDCCIIIKQQKKKKNNLVHFRQPQNNKLLVTEASRALIHPSDVDTICNDRFPLKRQATRKLLQQMRTADQKVQATEFRTVWLDFD